MNQSIITLYNYLQSQDNARQFLHHCYQKQDFADSNNWSYQNSERFYYMIKHGLMYYQSGEQAPLLLRPLLYYYGMMHMMKACLLVKVPTYPENTTLLAHGLSTRRKKRKNYQLLQDEVKIQQRGIFPYFSAQLFDVQTFVKDRFSIGHLLQAIPELDELFLLQQQATFITVGQLHHHSLTFPNTILDTYHLTQNRFIEKLQAYINITRVHSNHSSFRCVLQQPISAVANQPFYLHSQNSSIYFPLSRHIPFQCHEIMHHFMLLYQLSMLARYESEWWGDFTQMQQSKDYPIITQFLDITVKKVPTYLGSYLQQYSQ